ncbi:MAG: LysM peptidoglycan-binding domain-containing protein [Verrucomicrobia bacterium]|nr:LysM peptidoglycan-binding domain-containing protein [Verrucomicrobiota bacterium]
MTRRDTIIAAVLVNAGLLIVLFASALKSDTQEQEYTASATTRVEPFIEQVPNKEAVAAHGDEVDQVLKQYANPTPSVVTAVQPALTQSVETSAQPAQAPQNFADDLRAITLPEMSAQTASAPVAQAPVQATPAAVASGTTDYKVKKGDVLEKIARHHHCTVDEIMKLNKLSTANLRIGQTLKLPVKSSQASSIAKAPSPSSSSSATEGSPKYYTVKNGDNPWTIAVKNHMKVEDLLKLNNLDQEKARKLKPGDQLRIN